MSNQWHYISNGQQGGPVSAAELKQMADSSPLLPTDMVWTEGMAAWEPAGSLNGLFRSRAVQPPPAHQTPPAPVVRRLARHAFQGFRMEADAQQWGAWIAIIAAGVAAYFTWHFTLSPALTVVTTVLAACLGYFIGYKFAMALTVILVLGVVAGGALIFVGHQIGNKADPDPKENAVFEPKSLSTTLFWLTAKGQKVTELDEKKNEILSKKALEDLNRELAKTEGTQVQWQALVESVSPTVVTLRSPSIPYPFFLKFRVIVERKFPSDADPSTGLVLPINVEQSSKLGAGQEVQFTGRVLTFQAVRLAESLTFILVVSEAKLVE